MSKSGVFDSYRAQETPPGQTSRTKFFPENSSNSSASSTNSSASASASGSISTHSFETPASAIPPEEIVQRYAQALATSKVYGVLFQRSLAVNKAIGTTFYRKTQEADILKESFERTVPNETDRALIIKDAHDKLVRSLPIGAYLAYKSKPLNSQVEQAKRSEQDHQPLKRRQTL